MADLKRAIKKNPAYNNLRLGLVKTALSSSFKAVRNLTFEV